MPYSAGSASTRVAFNCHGTNVAVERQPHAPQPIPKVDASDHPDRYRPAILVRETGAQVTGRRAMKASSSLVALAPHRPSRPRAIGCEGAGAGDSGPYVGRDVRRLRSQKQ